MDSGQNKCLITVITVCYNAASSIECTIESVLEQSYPSLEYIVVDGGSSDGTVDIIKRYADRISKFISEPDKGIYDAMNKGLSMAHGEWVNFRNSGDRFVSPDAILNMFSAPVDENVSILHGDCIYVNEWGYKRMTPSCLHSSYKDGMPVLHPASFVRASLHKSHPFNLKYRLSGDYDFMFGCCERGDKFEYRPVAIAEFETGGTATVNLRKTYLEDCAIKGKGRISTLIGYVPVLVKTTLVRIAEKMPLLARMRNETLKKRGWKPLPYDKTVL